MTYPHRYDVPAPPKRDSEGWAENRFQHQQEYTCRCGVPDARDCPAAMRQHIADLSQLQASIHKAASAAVDAERAAVVAYMRGEAANALNILDVANDIEAGEHIAKEQG